MNFYTCVCLGNHQSHKNDIEHFYHAKSFAINLWYSTPWPQEHTDLYKLNYTVYTLWYLNSFTQHDFLRFIYVVACFISLFFCY